MRRVIAAFGPGFLHLPFGRRCKKKQKRNGKTQGRTPCVPALRHSAPTPHVRLREMPQGYGTALGYKGKTKPRAERGTGPPQVILPNAARTGSREDSGLWNRPELQTRATKRATKWLQRLLEK
jgi:hypothetical protein